MERERLARIERRANAPGLADALGECKPSDLHALLLSVFRRRGAARRPAQVLADYARSPFVRPKPVPVEALLDWDRAAFCALPAGFEALELSPLTPLATCSAVATVHPDKSVVTTRGLEVVSDPTNVLALEAALRRRADRDRVVRLAASHRVVRPHIPGVPHFRLFGAVSAARTGDGFIVAALLEHLAFAVDAVWGFVGPDVHLRVALTPLRTGDEGPWRESLIAPLADAFPAVDWTFDHERDAGRGYYGRLCYKIHAHAGDGAWLEIGDGGDVDWTAQLLADRRERCVISGLGSERIVALT